MKKRLFRSKKDKIIAGVCGGIAKYFDTDPTLVRILWAIISLLWGLGILTYLICWLVIPEEK